MSHPTVKPTRKQMLDRIRELERENELLRANKNYGTLTRQALEIEHRKLTDERYVIVLDIDHLHRLNQEHGSQEPVNAMIRRAFDFRHNDLLLKANYASGDEVVFIVRSDPEGFMKRLQEALKQEGITATMVYGHISDDDDLLDVCERAMQRVYELKAQRDVKR